MYFEVFIPSADPQGYDVKMTVEADNWMMALKSGLARTGESDELVRNVMCDIKEDNTIHVTDATSRRVFVLREVQESPDSQHPTVRLNADDVTNAIAESRRQTQPLDEKIAPKPSVPAAAPAPVPAAAQTIPAPLKPLPKPNLQPPSVLAKPLGQPSADVTQPNAVPPPRPAPADVTQPTPIELVKLARPASDMTQPTALADVAPSIVVDAALVAPTPSISVDPSLQQPRRPAQPTPRHESWTSEDGRVRIGSSTFEALRRDEPQAKVVEEKRVPTGSRPAIGRTPERVSDNVMEEVFLEINQIHEGDMSMEQVVNFVMDLSLDKVSAEAGSIMFADVNGKELYFATARGPKANDVMNFRVPMGKGIAGFCAREGVSLAISDAEKDPRFYREISEALGYPTQSMCCAPIQFEGRVFGAIELLNKANHHFEGAEVNVLTYIGRQLGKYVYDLIMAREKLE